MPIIHPLVADVVPFSYRDGDTYLEILSQYESVITKCVADIEEAFASINSYSAEVESIPVQIAEKVEAARKQLKRYIKQLFDELESLDTVISPVWGQRGQIDRVLGDMYNNLNTGGWSAYYHDVIQSPTAVAEDNQGRTARQYDLSPNGAVTTATAALVDAPSNNRTGSSDNPNDILGVE